MNIYGYKIIKMEETVLESNTIGNQTIDIVERHFICENADGTKEKVVQKVRVITTRYRRRKINNFGDGVNKSAGITIVGEPVSWLLTSKMKEVKPISKTQVTSQPGKYIPPSRRSVEQQSVPISERDIDKSVIKKDRYVPPNRRNNYEKSSEPESEIDKCKIKINNISSSTDEETLRDICSHYGRVIHLKIPYYNGEHSGYGFVVFSDHLSAQKALDKMDGMRLDHMVLVTEWAQPRKPKTNYQRKNNNTYEQYEKKFRNNS